MPTLRQRAIWLALSITVGLAATAAIVALALASGLGAIPAIAAGVSVGTTIATFMVMSYRFIYMER